MTAPVTIQEITVQDHVQLPEDQPLREFRVQYENVSNPADPLSSDCFTTVQATDNAAAFYTARDARPGVPILNIWEQ